MGRIAFLLLGSGFFFMGVARAQEPAKQFTHADTVRGSVTPERAWWDALRYDIRVRPDYDKKFIRGGNAIRFRVLETGQTMQIDLQEPMQLLSATWHKIALKFKKEGNAFYIRFPKPLSPGATETIDLVYQGNPRVAVRPPWDGGWIFTKDVLGRPWMSVACQGLGASVWYPCKDYVGDEPDSGASLAITVPDTLVAVGNGRLKNKTINGDGTATYHWVVVNPINNYDIVPYIGKYVSWHEQYAGEKGKLDCDYWVLDYDLHKARAQFKQADTMLHCFEYWMGPYPFYEDGYKLVEAPHLGMEHQSAVAYGNGFENGYMGRSYYGSPWGMKWDFIIVHESGHEWFGNSITAKDIADMWVQEGFTTYSEVLYTTCLFGTEAGNDYAVAIRGHISNDKPVIGPYGVNEEGSSDMYFKASQLLHIIRQLVGDDSVFRGLMRGLSSHFYHQTVSSAEIEAYIDDYTHKDLSKIFDQYLRTIKVPVLEYKTGRDGGSLSYRWTNCVKGFDMPVKISTGSGSEKWISPTEEWHSLPKEDAAPMAAGTNMNTNSVLAADRNFYIIVKKVD
jgi:aminopeptidase N